MNSLARAGARLRLAELSAEIDQLHVAFPGLASPATTKIDRQRRSADGDGQPQAPSEETKAPKRNPMSAAAKKAIGERMKRYWRARKKSSTPAAEKAAAATPPAPSVKRTMSAEARAKISAAQKRRWRSQKRAAKLGGVA